MDSGHGELASGLIGKGRLAEPEEIFDFVENHFAQNSVLKGQKWVITAGPTYEAIDPVRFIGNYSSGKMGVELAKSAAHKGAHVELISGPGTPKVDHPNVSQVYVRSAQEMFDATVPVFSDCDVAILAAAVADYTPENVADQKIKKVTTDLHILLKPTPDILKHLGTLKNDTQKLIGFALETNDEMANAQKKLNSKNLDMIVLNSLKDEGAGFGFDTNKISIIYRDNKVIDFELKSKSEVAEDIIQSIVYLK
jgi:phosphopantothenoylcysteine decarboxylase/phosphopantothenate--cysteine ligase